MWEPDLNLLKLGLILVLVQLVFTVSDHLTGKHHDKVKTRSGKGAQSYEQGV